MYMPTYRKAEMEARRKKEEEAKKKQDEAERKNAVCFIMEL